jgi:hypothetical protein
MDSKDLKTLVIALYEKYKETDPDLASIQLGEEKWSVKEIIGHLIDSAANNYQRFIRLQESKELNFPGYDYTWIKLIPYNSYPFEPLIELWKHFNLLLCHIIDNLDEETLSHIWKSEEGDKSLSFLVEDYIVHLKFHIEHLADRIKELNDYQIESLPYCPSPTS